MKESSLQLKATAPHRVRGKLSSTWSFDVAIGFSFLMEYEFLNENEI